MEQSQSYLPTSADEDLNTQAIGLYFSFNDIHPNMLLHFSKLISILPKSSNYWYGSKDYRKFRIAVLKLYSQNYTQYNLDKCMKYIHPDERSIFMYTYNKENPIRAANMYKKWYDIGLKIAKILY